MTRLLVCSDDKEPPEARLRPHALEQRSAVLQREPVGDGASTVETPPFAGFSAHLEDQCEHIAAIVGRAQFFHAGYERRVGHAHVSAL